MGSAIAERLEKAGHELSVWNRTPRASEPFAARGVLALALDAAHEAGVPLPLPAATQQLVEGCIAGGMGDDDLTALLPRLRREAGL
jgi:3-hydroxyisobutyrate dehydrogenase-like beta-hydroxyacid dehydrogenase